MNHEFWYLSRAAGFTAYMLLFLSVALGIGMGTRLTERFAPRNLVFDMHRFVAILALAFTLLHVYVLLADGYFNFNVWQLSLPFLSPYRSWQTAAGVFSLYVLVIVVISFFVRRYIGYRAWRSLHYLTFGLFAAAMLHGITAGTDTQELWSRVIYVTTGLLVLALIGYRLQYRLPDNPSVRTIRLAAGSATIIAAIVLIFGTGLLSSARSASTAAGNGASSGTNGGGKYPFLPRFSDDLSGTYHQSQSATDSSLSLDANATGDLPTRLHAELVQSMIVPTPDNEDGESDPNDDEAAEARPRTTVTVNQARLLDAESGALLCDGKLTSLNNGALRATCTGSGPYDGIRMNVASQLQAGSDGTLTGPLTGTMERG